MFKKLIQNKPLFVTIIIAVVAVISGSVFFLSFEGRDGGIQNANAAILSVSATESATHGVKTDTGFLLQCSEKMNEDEVRASLKVAPDLTYNLAKKAKDQYILTFEDKLEPDSVISFAQTQAVKPHSWAFQTENVFQVINSLPNNKASRVPVNSGIEVRFSYLDVMNFKDSFKINPATEGNFEKHGKTWVFVPKALNSNTLYTVTIDKGLESSGGGTLGEDYVFSFRTGEIYPVDASYLYISGEQVETFTPSALPIIEVMNSEHFKDTAFDIKVYKYTNAESYLNALKARHVFLYDQIGYAENYFASTEGLNEVSSFQTKIQRSEMDYWRSGYMVFPDKLPVGYYLIDINAQNSTAKCGGHLQKYIQVHPYAVYSMSVNGSELIWVNDTTSGSPVGGANVSINNIKGNTASDGTARINTPDLKNSDFSALKIEAGNLPFVTELDLAQANDYYKMNEEYYTYIYTDREQYQPSDNIYVWGVVLSKDGKSKPPQQAQLQLKTGYYKDGLLAKTEVSLDESGAFSGKIPISALAADNYEIALTKEDITYCSKYIAVGEYVKPAYQIEASVDKPVYFAWEPINLIAQVNFFDGTPAGNMPFTLYNGNTGNRINVKSDAKGNISQKLYYQDGSKKSWYPRHLYYEIATAGAEDTLSSLEKHVTVMPRDIMVNTTMKENKDGFSLEVMTNKIDLSSIKNTEEVYEDNYAKIKGAAINIPVTLKIIEVTWNKVQIGSYYDFINKVSVPQYQYDRIEKQVAVRNGDTVNGKIVFDNLDYQNNWDKYYYTVMECSDTRGSKIQEEIYFFSDIYPRDTNIKYYDFYRGNDDSLSLGDTVKISLRENYQPLTGKGKILYAKVQNRLSDYHTVNTDSFNYTFSKEDIPNIYFYGAYFDGENIYPVDCERLYYDPGDMGLNVEVNLGSNSLSPGDKASLEIRVTNKDKKPVKGAAVCVSIVDEAAFAVADQNADPLRSIYSKRFYQNVSTYASYVQHDLNGNGGAEQGGEGGSTYVRKNFLDTAAFLTATTVSNGTAVLNFQMPDNLTSWRITSLAVADGVYAGKNITNIVTTQPFFASLIINQVFIAGDDLSASMRGFGTALSGGEAVDFQADLTYPDGSKKSITASAKKGEYVNFNFGSGPVGEYTLTVSAKSAAGTDAIEKSFRVVQSALEIPVTKTFNLAKGIDINALRSPVMLAFFNQTAELYYQCLSDLAAESGERADISVSRTVAQKLLKEYYGHDLPYYFYGADSEDTNPGAFQDYRGGVRLLDYSDSYADLTAMMCVSAPEYLNTAAAANYLNNIIDDKRSGSDEVAVAYMGLAALHKPVLLDIRYLLSDQAENFTLQEKLYLIAALALIGDMDTARQYYDQIVVPLLKENDPWIYVDSGNTKDIDIESTALAAITAISIGDKNADGMMFYIISNSSNEVTTCLEKLFYVKKHPQYEHAAASFSYTVDGKTETIQLEKNRPYMLVMTKEQIKASKFKVLSGKIGVAASYTGSVSDIADKMAELVSIDKTLDTSSDKIKQSALVKITINPKFSEDAPKGWYEVSDYIPSGMRYVSYEHAWDNGWWLENIEGQKISFSVINPDKNPKGIYYRNITTKPIVYYVRATLSGNFIIDSTYIKNTETSAWGMSQRKDIMISD